MRFSTPSTRSRLRSPISVSTSMTLAGRASRARRPTFAVVVVLPTPPLPDVTTIRRPLIRLPSAWGAIAMRSLSTRRPPVRAAVARAFDVDGDERRDAQLRRREFERDHARGDVALRARVRRAAQRAEDDDIAARDELGARIDVADDDDRPDGAGATARRAACRDGRACSDAGPPAARRRSGPARSRARPKTGRGTDGSPRAPAVREIGARAGEVRVERTRALGQLARRSARAARLRSKLADRRSRRLRRDTAARAAPPGPRTPQGRARPVRRSRARARRSGIRRGCRRPARRPSKIADGRTAAVEIRPLRETCRHLGPRRAEIGTGEDELEPGRRTAQHVSARPGCGDPTRSSNAGDATRRRRDPPWRRRDAQQLPLTHTACTPHPRPSLKTYPPRCFGRGDVETMTTSQSPVAPR